MIDPKQIPDEVILAARDAYMRSQEHISENMRAAIAAALSAWPEGESIQHAIIAWALAKESYE